MTDADLSQLEELQAVEVYTKLTSLYGTTEVTFVNSTQEDTDAQWSDILKAVFLPSRFNQVYIEAYDLNRFTNAFKDWINDPWTPYYPNTQVLNNMVTVNNKIQKSIVSKEIGDENESESESETMLFFTDEGRQYYDAGPPKVTTLTLKPPSKRPTPSGKEIVEHSGNESIFVAKSLDFKLSGELWDSTIAAMTNVQDIVQLYRGYFNRLFKSDALPGLKVDIDAELKVIEDRNQDASTKGDEPEETTKPETIKKMLGELSTYLRFQAWEKEKEGDSYSFVTSNQKFLSPPDDDDDEGDLATYAEKLKKELGDKFILKVRTDRGGQKHFSDLVDIEFETFKNSNALFKHFNEATREFAQKLDDYVYSYIDRGKDITIPHYDLATLSGVKDYTALDYPEQSLGVLQKKFPEFTDTAMWEGVKLTLGQLKTSGDNQGFAKMLQHLRFEYWKKKQLGDKYKATPFLQLPLVASMTETELNALDNQLKNYSGLPKRLNQQNTIDFYTLWQLEKAKMGQIEDADYILDQIRIWKQDPVRRVHNTPLTDLDTSKKESRPPQLILVEDVVLDKEKLPVRKYEPPAEPRSVKSTATPTNLIEFTGITDYPLDATQAKDITFMPFAWRHGRRQLIDKLLDVKKDMAEQINSLEASYIERDLPIDSEEDATEVYARRLEKLYNHIRFEIYSATLAGRQYKYRSTRDVQITLPQTSDTAVYANALRNLLTENYLYFPITVGGKPWKLHTIWDAELDVEKKKQDVTEDEAVTNVAWHMRTYIDNFRLNPLPDYRPVYQPLNPQAFGIVVAPPVAVPVVTIQQQENDQQRKLIQELKEEVQDYKAALLKSSEENEKMLEKMGLMEKRVSVAEVENDKLDEAVTLLTENAALDSKSLQRQEGTITNLKQSLADLTVQLKTLLSERNDSWKGSDPGVKLNLLQTQVKINTYDPVNYAILPTTSDVITTLDKTELYAFTPDHIEAMKTALERLSTIDKKLLYRFEKVGMRIRRKVVDNLADTTTSQYLYEEAYFYGTRDVDQLLSAYANLLQDSRTYAANSGDIARMKTLGRLAQSQLGTHRVVALFTDANRVPYLEMEVRQLAPKETENHQRQLILDLENGTVVPRYRLATQRQRDRIAKSGTVTLSVYQKDVLVGAPQELGYDMTSGATPSNGGRAIVYLSNGTQFYTTSVASQQARLDMLVIPF